MFPTFVCYFFILFTTLHIVCFLFGSLEWMYIFMLNLAYCVTALANKGSVIVIRDIVNNIADKCDVTIFYIDDIVEVEFPESVKLVNWTQPFNIITSQRLI